MKGTETTTISNNGGITSPIPTIPATARKPSGTRDVIDEFNKVTGETPASAHFVQTLPLPPPTGVSYGFSQLTSPTASGQGLIYKKMVAVMKEIGTVGKDQKNVVQGFKFRGIDQFVNALHPALIKNGVFLTPSCTSYEQELKEVVRSNGKAGVDKHVSIQMSYTFYAEDGSFVVVGPIPAEGLDSGDKATNKALSAGLKYALIQTFSVPTEDMAEGDLESPEIGAPRKEGPQKVDATPAQVATLNSANAQTVPVNNVTTAVVNATPTTTPTDTNTTVPAQTVETVSAAPAATTTTTTTAKKAKPRFVAPAKRAQSNGGQDGQEE